MQTPKQMISEVEQRKYCGQLCHKVEHPGLPWHIRTFRKSGAEQSLQLTVHQYSDMAGHRETIPSRDPMSGDLGTY